LIGGAGFLASLLLSGYVFWEMVEQPLEIIDSEIETIGRMAARMILTGREKAGLPLREASLPEGDRYWITIQDENSGKELYRSRVARLVDIPLADRPSRATVGVVVPPSRIRLGQDRGDEVTFRMGTFRFNLDGRPILLQIGRPSEWLEEEILDIAVEIAGGLAFSTLFLLVISHFIAGIILKPVGAIGDLTREINEKSLDQRIPAGKERDEFNALAGTINRMLDRLQHSFAKQKRFLADTSHDLKTPLTMLRLSMDEILSGNREDVPDSLRRVLVRQNIQILRMERLVKNLLELSSLEISESIDFRPVDLTSLLESLLEDYGLLADKRNIGIRTRLPGKVAIQGDPDKMTRALSNLLDNAVKYNRDGGQIDLELTIGKENIRIAIANTGMGIPRREIDKVFDQFYRVERSRSLRYGGSGLGLAIVKRIVELHGGSIEIESEQDAWTKVSVLLPSYLLIEDERKKYESWIKM